MLTLHARSAITAARQYSLIFCQKYHFSNLFLIYSRMPADMEIENLTEKQQPVHRPNEIVRSVYSTSR